MILNAHGLGGFHGIRAPFPVFAGLFPGPSAPVQPTKDPGKHPQQAIPPLRGASLDPIEWKSFVSGICLIPEALLRGKPRPIPPSTRDLDNLCPPT